MATTIRLEYFYSDVGTSGVDNFGNDVIIYSNKHMYTSELTSEHNAWEDAIMDVCEFMDIEVDHLERLQPKALNVYRVHTKPNTEYRIVWAKIQKEK